MVELKCKTRFSCRKKKGILRKLLFWFPAFSRGHSGTPMNNLPQEIEHLLTILKRLIKGTQRTKSSRDEFWEEEEENWVKRMKCVFFFFFLIPLHRESSIIHKGYYKDTVKISYPYRTMDHSYQNVNCIVNQILIFSYRVSYHIMYRIVYRKIHKHLIKFIKNYKYTYTKGIFIINFEYIQLITNLFITYLIIFNKLTK